MMAGLYENRARRELNENRARWELNENRAQRRLQMYLTMAPGQQLYLIMATGSQLYETMARQMYETMAPGLQLYLTMAPGLQLYLTISPGPQLYQTMAPGQLDEMMAWLYNEMMAWLNEMKAWLYNEMMAWLYQTMAPGLQLYLTMAPGQLDEMMAWLYNEMRAWLYEMMAWLYNEMMAWLYEMMGQLSWQQPTDVFSWLRLCSEDLEGYEDFTGYGDLEEDFTGYEDLADGDVTRWFDEISMLYNGIQMLAPCVLYTNRTIDALLSYYVGIQGLIFAPIFAVKAVWWGWAFLVLVSAFILTRVLYPRHIIYKLLSYYMGTYGMIFAAIFSLPIINIKMLVAIWWTFPILLAMILAIVINLFRHRTACTDLRHYILQLKMSRDKLKKSPEGISLSGRHPRFHSSLLRSSKRAIMKGKTILRDAGTVEDDEPIDLDDIDLEVELIADDDEFLEPQGIVEDGEPIDLDQIDPEVEWIVDDDEFFEPEDFDILTEANLGSDEVERHRMGFDPRASSSGPRTL